MTTVYKNVPTQIYIEKLDSDISMAFVLRVQRVSDSYWWDGTIFDSPYSDVDMVETDQINFPGRYHYDFTFSNVGLYIAKAVNVDPTYNVNFTFQCIELKNNFKKIMEAIDYVRAGEIS